MMPTEAKAPGNKKRPMLVIVRIVTQTCNAVIEINPKRSPLLGSSQCLFEKNKIPRQDARAVATTTAPATFTTIESIDAPMSNPAIKIVPVKPSVTLIFPSAHSIRRILDSSVCPFITITGRFCISISQGGQCPLRWSTNGSMSRHRTPKVLHSVYGYRSRRESQSSPPPIHWPQRKDQSPSQTSCSPSHLEILYVHRHRWTYCLRQNHHSTISCEPKLWSTEPSSNLHRRMLPLEKQCLRPFDWQVDWIGTLRPIWQCCR